MDGSKNIFIIDSSSSVRKSLSRLLRIAGFNVKYFTSAVDFLNVFETGMLGCLILDMSMLSIFGDELVEELKGLENSLKIIVISTNDDQKTKKIANDLNAIGFFRKPVDGYALIDSINWTLKNNLYFDNNKKI